MVVYLIWPTWKTIVKLEFCSPSQLSSTGDSSILLLRGCLGCIDHDGRAARRPHRAALLRLRDSSGPARPRVQRGLESRLATKRGMDLWKLGAPMGWITELISKRRRLYNQGFMDVCGIGIYIYIQLYMDTYIYIYNRTLSIYIYVYTYYIVILCICDDGLKPAKHDMGASPCTVQDGLSQWDMQTMD